MRRQNLTNDFKSSQAITQKGMFSAVSNCYQSYRKWQKMRGRSKKAKKHLSERMDFYSQFIKKGDLCFDIGANTGNRTEALLKLGARVVAVEPQETCACTLHKRFGGNENFVLVTKALDNVEGEKEFFLSSAHTLSSMSTEWIEHVQKEGLFEGHRWDQKTTVPTTTLDALIGTYGLPVFCKIDVEGFEHNVLLGLSQPIKVISFEFTGGLCESTTNCVRYLSQLGHVEFNYARGESMSFVLPNWVKPEKIIEIVTALPENEGVCGDTYARFCKEQTGSSLDC